MYRFWILLLGVIVSLILFEEVVDDVFFDRLEGDLESEVFDQAITDWVQSFRSPQLTQIMTDLTALGSVSVIVCLFVILASVVATFRDFKGLVYLGTVLLGAGIWPFLLKPLFGRPRPVELQHLVEVSNLSFPSGHSFGATAIYLGLAFYAGRYARKWPQEIFFYVLGGLVILLVALSRIYLGVHFPTDVLGGMSAGAAWGFFVSAVYECIRSSGFSGIRHTSAKPDASPGRSS